MAFADDLLILSESQVELDLILNEFISLDRSGLKLNIKKSQIMSSRKDMENVEEISGIKVTKSIKYLGMNLFCDRKNNRLSQETNAEICVILER